MGDTKCGQGRKVWCFLLSVAVACLASGAALATCTPPGTINPGDVLCYMTVQPVDVGTTAGAYAPFNTVSATAGFPNGSTTLGLPAAGNPPQTVLIGPSALVNQSIPNNSRSPNPIGFVVDPSSGLSPGQPTYDPTKGVDVTRKVLNELGIELVWLPMTTYQNDTLTQLDVDLGPTGPTIATCTGFILGTTLTVSSCTTGSQPLAVYDFLSWPLSPTTSNTYITALVSGVGGAGTYTVSQPLTVGASGKKQVTITAQSFTNTSSQFKTLSDQVPSASPPTPPCSISQMTVPANGCGSPSPPLAPDPRTVNLFFVNNLNPPPALGGTLYGLGWLCNNGVAISATTFQPARPDTIAHELMHNLCLDHGNYGAGPWIAPTNADGSYSKPFGVVPLTQSTYLPGQCDPNYPACNANLMTSGDHRTEPTLACILAGMPGTSFPTSACTDASGNQKPGLFNPNPKLATDQVNFPSSASSTLLPVSQQAQVLGRSGLLFDNTPKAQFSGLLSPIPQETTKAQLGTGQSSPDRAIFDLSGPAGGKPGETLLGWVLTLPQEQTFAKHDGFHIVSQSRKDLVQDVNYYPNPMNNPLKRNIAYQPGDDNNADNPSIAAAGPSPCAFETAECLVVKFQPPGLEANDSISFSKSILSGDAPITNEDLCKAKITYIFSDGFVTTSNFDRCSPVSLPLIASSWHPDPYVAPHVVKSDLLLAQGAGSQGCTPDDTTGKCPDLDIRDHDVTKEAGNQTPQSCDGGATLMDHVTGILSGPNITIQGGATCYYQDCEFKGSLIINNATAYLKHCQVDGQLTMNSGTLHLDPLDNSNAPSVVVIGTTTIGSTDQRPNSFVIGPSGQFNGLVTIQNGSAGGLGYVCGSTFSTGMRVNNNASLIEIGPKPGQPPPPPNCPFNTIAGGLKCTGNTPGTLTGSGNHFVTTGFASGDCTGF